MSTELTVPDSSARAEEVRQQLLSIKTDLVRRSLEMGRLLMEVKENNYHMVWGYQNFRTWLEESSGLDISERTAYSMLKVVKMQQRLGLSDEEIERNKISKLIEIASLPEDLDEDKVRGLIQDAESSPLSTVKEIVGALKNEVHVYKTLKFDEDGAEVWSSAIERARQTHGGFEGGVDISESTAAIYLAAEFLAMPQEFDIADDDDTEPAFQDVYEAA